MAQHPTTVQLKYASWAQSGWLRALCRNIENSPCVPPLDARTPLPTAESREATNHSLEVLCRNADFAHGQSLFASYRDGAVPLSC